MIEEPQKTTDRENKHQEEEVNHDNIGNFMRKVNAKQRFTLTEEVEGKLFDISFIYNEEKNPRKGILSEVLGDAVVEECSEC